MLIGIDASRSAVEQRTGTEAYSYFLIRALIQTTSDSDIGLRLYFNTLPKEGIYPQAPHVEQKTITFPRLWTHIRLAAELHSNPPDIFFTPAHVIPFSYRGPSSATVHDLGFLHFPDAHTRSQRFYLNLSTRTNSHKSRRIITDSQATKDDLVGYYQLDPEKIDVIYPGIDPEIKRIANGEKLAKVQQKYGINPPYLLFLGTLQPRKNLARLVRAFALCGLDHQLVLAGKIGWRSETILDEIQKLSPDIRKRVHLPGFVDDQDKAALLSGATAVLFPSLYEGFGFPLLEAQACGTPVLAANASSLPEIAGGAALLVDPQNTEALVEGILQIVKEKSLQQKLIAAGLENVQRFSWDNTAAKVLESLKRAASGS